MSVDQLSLQLFTVGDLVDVKGHGRASVIGPLIQDPSHKYHGRHLVRYHEDDTTFHVGYARLRLMFPTESPIVVARSTDDYRDAAVFNVDWTDVCLEVGCHEGMTTLLLSNRVKWVAGIDLTAEVIAKAHQRHPQLHFFALDGMDTAATAACSPTGTYTKVFIDISGKAPLELIAQMITAQRVAFPHAKLIVKNEALHDALLQLEKEGETGSVFSGMACLHLDADLRPGSSGKEHGSVAPRQDDPGSAAETDMAHMCDGADPHAQPIYGTVGSSLQEPAGSIEAEQGAHGSGMRASQFSVKATLESLLGCHLSECERFVHGRRPARTRPYAPLKVSPLQRQLPEQQ